MPGAPEGEGARRGNLTFAEPQACRPSGNAGSGRGQTGREGAGAAAKERKSWWGRCSGPEREKVLGGGRKQKNYTCQKWV